MVIDMNLESTDSRWTNRCTGSIGRWIAGNQNILRTWMVVAKTMWETTVEDSLEARDRKARMEVADTMRVRFEGEAKEFLGKVPAVFRERSPMATLADDSLAQVDWVQLADYILKQSVQTYENKYRW